MPIVLSDIESHKLALWIYQQWRMDDGALETILKIAERLNYLAQEEIAEQIKKEETNAMA